MKKKNQPKVKKRNTVISGNPTQCLNAITMQPQASLTETSSVAFERQRISQILHDELQPLLVSARMFLASINDQSDYKATLMRVDAILVEAIQTSRNLTTKLTSNVETLGDGLNAIARWAFDNFALKIALNVAPNLSKSEIAPDGLLPNVRELVFNSAKHAKVTSLCVSADRTDKGLLRVTVSDTGVGFDHSTTHESMGLCRMRRWLDSVDGRLEVQSAPGAGSRFTIICPLS